MTTRLEKQQEFQRLIERLEREFGRTYIAEVASLIRDNLSISRLTQLIRDGDIAAIQRIIRDEIIPLIGSEIVIPALEPAIVRGAGLAASQDPGTVGQIVFDPRAAAVEEFVDTTGAQLVVTPADIPDIRRWIGIAENQGKSAEWAATQIQPSIGLHSQYSNAVLNLYDAQIAEGVSADRAAEVANRHADRLLRTRSRTIARTELGRAAGQGRQAAWDQAIADGFLDPRSGKVWATARDGKVGEDHEQMEGEKVGLTERWLTPNDNLVIHPTDDRPNCRCASVLEPFRQTRSL